MSAAMKQPWDEPASSGSVDNFRNLEKTALRFHRVFAEKLIVEPDGSFECSLPAELLLGAFRYESCFRGFRPAASPEEELLPQASPSMRMARELNLAYRRMFLPRDELDQALGYRDILDAVREAMGMGVRVRFAPEIRTSGGARFLTIRGEAIPDDFAPDYRE